MYKINLKLKGDGIYDLPFIGNLGEDGEKALINKITEYQGYYLLIHSYKNYWQESDIFRNYIKNNYKLTGIINDFEIYYIK